MRGKLDIFNYSLIGFTIIYLLSIYYRIDSLALLYEDILMPVVFFLLFSGYNVLIYSMLALFFIAFNIFRFVLTGNVEVLISIFYGINYIIGGYFYYKKDKFWIIYPLVIFTGLGVLATPYISENLYLYFLKQKELLIVQFKNYIATKDYITMSDFFIEKLICGLEYMIFPLEILFRLLIAFLVIKIVDRLTDKDIYSHSLVYFHRKYGRIVVYFFVVITLMYVLRIKNILIYSLPLFGLYFIFTGIVSFLEWEKLYIFFRKSIWPIIILIAWALLVLAGENYFIIALSILVIYSVYMALNGDEVIKKLIIETLNKPKGDGK